MDRAIEGKIIMGIWESFFGYTNRINPNDELPNIYPLGMLQKDFLRIDVENIYKKILTDVIERTHGLTEEQTEALWDNCLKSQQTYGLITLLSKAMQQKSDLFLVYDRAINILRVATPDEQALIRQDYATRGESEVGHYVSFSQLELSDMLRLYSALEYCTIDALNKSMNLSKAVQIKMSDVRGSVALTDSTEAKAQALRIATGLRDGKDVLMDAKDLIETAVPQLTAVNQSMTFINQKRSFYLGLPESYMVGIQTGGLGSTGEQDTKATERGLKQYFVSIVKPILESLFQTTVTYKSQDFRQVAVGLQALQTFELVDSPMISDDEKRKVIEVLFDFEKRE